MKVSASHLVVALLVAHLGYGAARLVQSGYIERAREVVAWRSQDPVDWHFRKADPETQRIARWIVEALPDGHGLLYEGEVRGSLQLIAGLISPRVLLRAEVVAKRSRNEKSGRSRSGSQAKGRTTQPELGSHGQGQAQVYEGVPAWFGPAPRGVVVIGDREKLRLRRR